MQNELNESVSLKTLMTTNLYTLKENDSVNMARFLMEAKHIRHIPIINENYELQGLLTHRDILALSISTLAEIDSQTQAQLHQETPIREVMRKDLLTAEPDTEILTAAEQLLQHKYGCLLVVVNKTLVGIVTEADFVRLFVELLRKMELQ